MYKHNIHSKIVVAMLFAGAELCQGANINLNAQAYVGGTNSLYQSAYNYNAYPNDIPSSTTGSTQVNACNPFTNCTLNTNLGTRDALGTATAGFESVAITSVTPPDILGDPAYTAHAAAYASASLAAGTLGVAASGDYLDRRFSTSGQDGGSGLGQALLNDVLHFAVAGANSATLTSIGVSYILDGSVTSLAAGDSGASTQTALSFGTGTVNVYIVAGAGNYTPRVTSATDSNWLSANFSQLTPNRVVFNGVYQLTGAAQDVGVQTYLAANCGIGDSCDFSHTARLSLTDPASVTYTSDSGTFLTQVPSSVPEPATYAIFASGLGLIAILRRSMA